MDPREKYVSIQKEPSGALFLPFLKGSCDIIIYITIMGEIMKTSKTVRNILVSAGVPAASFIISLLFQHIFEVHEHITTLFVFAVFLISLLTEGYIYGLISAIVSQSRFPRSENSPYNNLRQRLHSA